MTKNKNLLLWCRLLIDNKNQLLPKNDLIDLANTDFYLLQKGCCAVDWSMGVLRVEFAKGQLKGKKQTKLVSQTFFCNVNEKIYEYAQNY